MTVIMKCHAKFTCGATASRQKACLLGKGSGETQHVDVLFLVISTSGTGRTFESAESARHGCAHVLTNLEVSSLGQSEGANQFCAFVKFVDSRCQTSTESKGGVMRFLNVSVSFLVHSIPQL